MRQTLSLFPLTFLAIACGAEAAPATDGRVLDASLDSAEHDGALDGSGSDGSSRDVATSDANAYGFVVRMPGEIVLGGSQTAYQDKDFACTLRAGGNNAVVYVQATPTGIAATGFFPTPLYADVRAWLHDLNTMTTREIPARYDFGGGHNNDFFDITVGSQHFRYYHSSFGFGFRQCQPTDCVQIRNANGDVLEDGCTAARTLREICAAITSTAFPALTADTFVPCRS